jgi:hypothetical protein
MELSLGDTQWINSVRLLVRGCGGYKAESCASLDQEKMRVTRTLR